MKLYWITAPAGLALACVGLALIRVANGPHYNRPDSIIEQPRHLVTDQMIAETAAEANKLEPTIDAKTVDGKTVVLGSRSSAKPQFVYFVMDGCPCSYDAEPLFHDLFKQLNGKIDFVSVTNADAKKAKDWFGDLTVPYPVVSDPQEKIIHAYGARAAIYSALITKDGHIAKMWPGYSESILKDMNALMSKLAGIPEKPFDTKYAPVVKAAGCAFSDPNFK